MWMGKLQPLPWHCCATATRRRISSGGCSSMIGMSIAALSSWLFLRWISFQSIRCGGGDNESWCLASMLFDDLMVWLRGEYRRPSATIPSGHGMVVVYGAWWYHRWWMVDDTSGDCSGASVISGIRGWVQRNSWKFEFGFFLNPKWEAGLVHQHRTLYNLNEFEFDLSPF